MNELEQKLEIRDEQELLNSINKFLIEKGGKILPLEAQTQ